MLNAIRKRDRHVQKLNLKAKEQPVIWINSSEEEDEGTGLEAGPSSLRPVSIRSTTTSSVGSSPKRGRSPSLLHIGNTEGQDRSLSRPRLVVDQYLTGQPEDMDSERVERLRRRQAMIDEMQAELARDVLDLN